MTLAERLRKLAPHLFRTGTASDGRLTPTLVPMEVWSDVCAVVGACQSADHNKQGDALIALAKRMDEEGL